jgi:Papain fold toxin 1, glutamine deamidase
MNEYDGGGDAGASDGPEVPAHENIAPQSEYPDVGSRGPGGSSGEASDPVRDNGVGKSEATGSSLDDTTDGEVGAPRAGLRDVPASHPENYVPSDAPLPHVDRPHQSPETWIEEVNPDRTAPGRYNNCGECARATQSTWQGEPVVAAAMRDPDSGGEEDEVMEEAVGVELTATSIDEVGQRLVDLGPGSSAVVGVGWQDGNGHWFNAVNDAGTVKAVDGQIGSVEGWPPSKAGVGYDASEMESVEAIFFDADGRVVRLGTK